MEDLTSVMKSLVKDDHLRCIRGADRRLIGICADAYAATKLQLFEIKVGSVPNRSKEAYSHYDFGQHFYAVSMQGLQSALGNEEMYMAMLGIRDMPAVGAHVEQVAQRSYFGHGRGGRL